MKNYVIIGGGVAAIGCVEGIRSVDKESKITLIADEGRPVYCRPLISYYLQGKTDFERMKYRDDQFYSQNGVDLVYDKAVGIDTQNKTVVTQNGAFPFDEVCVATGSSPFVPPFDGLDTVSDKFSFMTENDAEALNAAVEKTSRVLIVGAGLIGLKCAEGLCGKVDSITVCDLADRVLSSILDAQCAALMQSTLEDHGVRFMLSDSAVSFNKNVAMMKSGARVKFDILVLAVGVRANISLIKDIGGSVDRGIIVDTKMRTSKEHIYSAGDCAQGYDSSTDSNRVLAIMPNAYMQGHCAGVNMAGGDSRFENAVPLNAIGFFGVHALTCGSYDGEMFEESGGGTVKRLFVRDNRLVGFILINAENRAGIYTSLVRNKTPLDTLDFDTLKKYPSLAPFSANYRGNILKGVV